jgi:hypothetical protein
MSDDPCSLPAVGMCPERKRLRALNAKLVAALRDIQLDATDIHSPVEQLLREIAAKARAVLAKAKP